MKKIIISVILTVCILIGTLTGASASVMIVSSTNAYDDSDAMYANLDRAIAALNNQVIVKGKSFSFNEVVGPRTDENGFASAPMTETAFPSWAAASPRLPPRCTWR